jgi:hypothetical protein
MISNIEDFQDEEENFLFKQEYNTNPDWLISDCKTSKKNSDNAKLYKIENRKNKLQLFSNKVPVLKFQLKQDEINAKTMTGYRNFKRQDVRKYINLSNIPLEPSLPTSPRHSRKSSPRSSVRTNGDIIFNEAHITLEEEQEEEEKENLSANQINDSNLNEFENLVHVNDEIIINNSNNENIDEAQTMIKLKEESKKILISSIYLSIYNLNVFKSYCIYLALYKFKRKRSTRILRLHITNFLLKKRKKMFSLVIPIQFIMKLKRIRKNIAQKQLVRFLYDSRKYGVGGIGAFFTLFFYICINLLKCFYIYSL